MIENKMKNKMLKYSLSLVLVRVFKFLIEIIKLSGMISISEQTQSLFAVDRHNLSELQDLNQNDTVHKGLLSGGFHPIHISYVFLNTASDRVSQHQRHGQADDYPILILFS